MPATQTAPAMSAPRATGRPMGPTAQGRVGWRPSGRRVLAGVLLVLLTVLVFWQVQLRHDPREPVLAVARSVAAGQAIAAADLRTVRAAVEDGVQVVPADRLDTVVGRTAATPLTPGSLLTPGQVGPAGWPAPGEAVVAVPVKPGRVPAGLAAGARVVLLVVPTATGPSSGSGSSAAPGSGVTATVVAVVAASDQSGVQVVSLLLGRDGAVKVGAAAGEVSLVLLGADR